MEYDKVTYRQTGDGGWVARIERTDGRVAVHVNKSRSALQKLVNERYNVIRTLNG